MGQFNVSIVVPVFNEEEQAASLISRLTLLSDYVKDIILVDGGSTDRTVELLSKQFNVITSEKGRAKQMNAGAKQAAGTWLVFVHADTQFTSRHLHHLIEQATQFQWGRFNVQLDARGIRFRIIEWFINQRSRFTGVATGDQGIFVRKTLFDRLGGYADIPLMEDVDFSKRAKQLAKPACLKVKVATSARRWLKHGVIKTVTLMWKLRLLYWLGVEPEKLAKLYR